MSYNIAGEVETLSKRSNKDEGVTLLNNPAYREKYRERFDEAQKKLWIWFSFMMGQ